MNNLNTCVKRYELKYFITRNEYFLLKNTLSKIMQKDKNQQGDNYFIRSLYFDTPENKDYMTKVHGLKDRRKYRLRLYDPQSDYVKFEIKNRCGELIHKESTRISKEDALRVINQEYEPLLNYKSTTLNKAYAAFKNKKYAPKVVIDYRRDAYTLDFNNIRITFDTQIHKNESNYCVFDPKTQTTPVLNKNTIIMEVKYNNSLPIWIKNAIQVHRFTHCAISKYCLSRTF